MRRSAPSSPPRLQADVRSLGTQVGSQSVEAEGIAREIFEEMGPASEKPYIANGGRRKRIKLHWAAVDGAEVLPQTWSTKCGVRFAFWSFTRHASPDAFPPDARCAKCFGRPLLLPQVPSASSSSESSASSSS